MKRFFMLFCLVVFAVYSYAGCGETKQVKTPGFDWDAWISASNKQLEKVPVGGFAYKSSQVPPQEWDAWAKSAAPVVSGIINKLPEGYVLQITGHTDGSGPEDPAGAKPGNVKISTDRAKAVYNSLHKQGVTSPKLVYKGVGSSEPIPGVDPRDASQRRVTFVVVKKG